MENGGKWREVKGSGGKWRGKGGEREVEGGEEGERKREGEWGRVPTICPKTFDKLASMLSTGVLPTLGVALDGHPKVPLLLC